MEERDVLKEILKQALVCKTRLEEIVDFALAYSGKDLSVIFEKLATALKVSEGASCYSVELFSLKNAPLPSASPLLLPSFTYSSNLLDGNELPNRQKLE